MEVIKTNRGKPLLILGGYRYRVDRTSESGISWRCVNERSQSKCRGRAKTTLDHKLLNSTTHQCVPDEAANEVLKTKYNCKKRVREEENTPVNQIYKQEFANLYNQGFELVTKIPRYENIKATLCLHRRKVLGTIQNPTLNTDIKFTDEMLKMSDGENFLQCDTVSEEGKRILLFSGSAGRNLLKSRKLFFLDGTFKSCPKQFKQIYTIHADV